MSRRTRRALLASGTVLAAGVAVAGVGVTGASWTDRATANMGTGAPGSGVGNPHRFDIAVRDASGVLQDAPALAEAVELPLAAGSALSEDEPVRFDVVVVNRDPGVAGDLLVRVVDPDDTGAEDLFAALRFTVRLDGAAPAVTGATAAEVNAADLLLADVVPGAERTVSLEVVLAPGSTPASLGRTTGIAVAVDGESR